MAISRVITIVIVAASITTCHAIADLTGPTVLLLTPRHGEPYKERVQISLHVDVGEGPEAEAIAANPTDYQLCFAGGLGEPTCVPLLSGEMLPVIEVAHPVDGLSTISAWMQLNFTSASSANATSGTVPSTTVGPASAVGTGDVVYTWDSPVRAAQALRQRVASLQARATYAAANSPSSRGAASETAAALHERKQTAYHLGLALMRNERTTGATSVDPLAEAAAAFASAAALGSATAVGALEEVLWLSAAHRTSLHRRISGSTDNDNSRGSGSSSIRSKISNSNGINYQIHQQEPLPLFPCGFDGPLKRVVPTTARIKEDDGPHGITSTKMNLADVSEWLNISVNLMPYSSWGHAQAMLTEVITGSCQKAFSSPDSNKRETITAAGRAVMVAQEKALEAIGGDCLMRGLSAARREVARVCGDVGNLTSVVTVRTEEPTDINEHLPTLEALAFEAGSVLECGVRGVHSSWAFLRGLVRRRDADLAVAANPIVETTAKHGKDSTFANTCTEPFIVQNDLEDCYSPQFAAAAARADIPVRFHWKDDLSLDMPYDLGPQYVQGMLQSTIHPSVGLIFIDTLHVYGQLKRELALLAPFADMYLVMHDTTTDAIDGEAVRMGWSRGAHEVAIGRGWPEQDLLQGLWPAVTEFLADHQGEWQLHARYENNNGLTVLKRIGRPSRA